VRLGSVLMALTALQPQSEPKATPRSIGPRRPLANYSSDSTNKCVFH